MARTLPIADAASASTSHSTMVSSYSCPHTFIMCRCDIRELDGVERLVTKLKCNVYDINALHDYLNSNMKTLSDIRAENCYNYATVKMDKYNDDVQYYFAR